MLSILGKIMRQLRRQSESDDDVPNPVTIGDQGR